MIFDRTPPKKMRMARRFRGTFFVILLKKTKTATFASRMAENFKQWQQINGIFCMVLRVRLNFSTKKR